MDLNDLNTSLQDMDSLSSSDTEEKAESPQAIKKQKTTAKPNATKRKYRTRKASESISKVPRKYTKSNGIPKSNAYNKQLKGGLKTKSYYKQKGMPEVRTDATFSALSDSAHLIQVIGTLEKYNYKYIIRPDHNKQHDDFILQDKFMTTFFTKYPEYLCIDFLCEVTELELNLYLFISVDANGHCEIIAIGLFKSVESGFSWFFDCFKIHNPCWRRIKLITTDKLSRNNEIVKSDFPEKLVLVSFFHSMKALSKDLSNLDYNLTNEETNKVLQIFEQMIFAPDEATYGELLKQLKSMPPAVSIYFRKAWNQKRDTWALGTHLNSKVFLKSFNSYLNLIRKTIRPFVCTLDSIEEVINTLCVSIEQMRMGWFQKFSETFPILHDNKQTVLYRYSQYLTPYAVELVSEQINCSLDVKNIKKLACGKYVCNEEIISINTCSCNFFQKFSLPCVHIFSVRRLLSLPFYAESLCSPRWILSRYRNTFMDLQAVFAPRLQNSIISMSPEYFQQYVQISADLWPLLLSCPENVQKDRLLIFRNVLRAWEHGIKVNIKVCDSPKESFSNENTKAEVGNDYWKDMYGISLKDILDSDNDIACFPFTV